MVVGQHLGKPLPHNEILWKSPLSTHTSRDRSHPRWQIVVKLMMNYLEQLTSVESKKAVRLGVPTSMLGSVIMLL